MGVRLRYTEDAGLFSEGGEGIILDDMPAHTLSGSVKHFAGHGKLTVPGVSTAGGAGRTLTLPAPASCPGGIVTVRSTTAHAHTVKTAQDCSVISIVNTDGDATVWHVGNEAAMAAAANESASFLSDGVSWIVIGFNGTVNVS